MLKILRFNKFVPYRESIQLQERLVASKLANRENHPDYFLILQHEPCITAGKRCHAEIESLKSSSPPFNVFETPRGGRVTFHGPGQLTCYPIIDLKRQQEKLSLELHVKNLAAVMSLFLASTFSIADSFYESRPERVGLWLPENKKIGFIGIQAQKWVTSHGFSLNISPNCLRGFASIDPCGLAKQNVKITCAELEAPAKTLPQTDLEDAMIESFLKIFKYSGIKEELN